MTAGSIGDVDVTYVGHASVALDIAGTTVLTDPVLTGRLKHLRRVGRFPVDFDPMMVDVVLISHQHHDHLHVPSLKMLRRSVHVVIPSGAAPIVERLGFERVSRVGVGDIVEHGSLTITAVPAAHDDRRHPGRPRATPLGYVAESAGWAVYFAGDTAVFRDMGSIGDVTTSGLDLALVPVWGWGPTLGGGHLDPDGAADALELIEVRSVLPIHWGTLWPTHVRTNDRLILPPRELLKAARQRDLPVDILDVPPGTNITV